MVYMSSLLRYNRRHDLDSPSIGTIWVEIKLEDINLLLCCLYRSDLSLFINEKQNSIESALDKTPHVILTGDIKIDIFVLLVTK